MEFRRSLLFAGPIAIMLLLMTSSATASSYSVVAYGDSLSDNGNLFSYIGYPPAPYWNGRFSNGPVAVEQLAALGSAKLIDFAIGGATTGIGNFIDGGDQSTTLGLPGMQYELAISAPLVPTLPSDTIYVVWGGANDFFTGDSPSAAAANIDAFVGKLESLGAKHILVPGVPDLGMTPEFMGVAAATAYSLTFNTQLQAGLPGSATYIDTYGLLHNIVSNPGAFGLTNVTSPCFDKSTSTICVNPDQYLFWDGVHPTSAADAILAADFEAATTPEPSGWLLLGTGMAGLLLLLRKTAAT